METTVFRLIRTDSDPVEFNGRLLCSLKSPRARRLESKDSYVRWFEADIHETRFGTIIAAVRYRFRGPMTEEREYDGVFTADSPIAIVSQIATFDPTECVYGFPDGDYWNDRQKRLDLDIRRDWAALVEDLKESLSNLYSPATVIQ